jgi:hypothetical protein
MSLSNARDEKYARTMEEVRKKLASSFRDATPSEEILLDLVARELPIAHALIDAQRALTNRLPLVMDNASWVSALARALRDVTVVSHSVTKRVEGLLGAASNMQAQRRIVDLHGGARDK